MDIGVITAADPNNWESEGAGHYGMRAGCQSQLQPTERGDERRRKKLKIPKIGETLRDIRKKCDLVTDNGP